MSQDRDPFSFTFKTGVDFAALFLVGLISLVVQSALAWRASKLFLDRRGYRLVYLSTSALTILIGWLALVGAGALNLLSALPTSSTAVPDRGFTLAILFPIWLWMCAVQDLVTCLTLSILLRRAPGKVRGLSPTVQQRLRRLSTIVLRSGVPTAGVALLGALLGSVFHHPGLGMVHLPLAFEGPLSSLYTIWLIACLHQRQAPRSPATDRARANGHWRRSRSFRSRSQSEDKEEGGLHESQIFVPQLKVGHELAPQISTVSGGGTLKLLLTPRSGAPLVVHKPRSPAVQGIVITTETFSRIEVDEEDWVESSPSVHQSPEELEQTSRLYNAVFS